MGYQKMKEEDVFAAIVLLKFYQPEKRERNFDLDMEENCQVTLAFYKFLKKRCSAEVKNSMVFPNLAHQKFR